MGWLVGSLLFPSVMNTLVYFASSWLGLNYRHCTCLLVSLFQMSSYATAGVDLFNCLPIVGAECTAVAGSSLLRMLETREFVWSTQFRSIQRKNNKLKSYR